MQPHYRGNHNTPWAVTDTRRKLGVTPAELRILLGILSHERLFGHSPTRADLKSFLGANLNGYRLVREGLIESRIVGPIAGQYLAIWKATELAKRALGFEDEERRTA
jgi:hypothetical protein